MSRRGERPSPVSVPFQNRDQSYARREHFQVLYRISFVDIISKLTSIQAGGEPVQRKLMLMVPELERLKENLAIMESYVRNMQPGDPDKADFEGVKSSYKNFVSLLQTYERQINHSQEGN